MWHYFSNLISPFWDRIVHCYQWVPQQNFDKESNAMTRRMLRLLSAAIVTVSLFLLLILFTSSPLSFMPLTHEFNSDSFEWSYGVIIDAGSTGSRLFLYRWRTISENKLIEIHPVVDSYNKPVVKKINPGLSSFASSPNNATGYIRPLLDYAINYVPKNKIYYTPIFIFATAGMRLLPLSTQEAILTNLRANLPLVTPMQVIPENIQVIQGKWEGIYSWIAVNYILGRFDVNKSRTNRRATVGMADMGGASVQLAFEVDQQDSSRKENYEEVNLGCNNDDLYRYRLFVTTFLGYGVNEGLHKYEEFLSRSLVNTNESSLIVVRDPCMPVNLVRVVEEEIGSQFALKGSGDWDKCVASLSKLINTSSNTECLKEKCFLGKVVAPKQSLSSMELYGFSEYWFSLEDVLDLGGTYNLSAVSIKARRFCRQKWSNIRSHMALYPKADEIRLRSQCFKSAWVTAVLHSGFNVDRISNHFQSVLDINGQEVQWALGAMLYHLRCVPLRDSQRNLWRARRRGLENGSRGSYFMVFLFIIVAVLVFLYRR